MDKASERQVGGDHYTAMGIDPLEYTYQNYGYIGVKAAIHTKLNKYFRGKDDELQDLRKAEHVIQMLIEFKEREDDRNKGSRDGGTDTAIPRSVTDSAKASRERAVYGTGDGIRSGRTGAGSITEVSGKPSERTPSGGNALPWWCYGRRT